MSAPHPATQAALPGIPATDPQPIAVDSDEYHRRCALRWRGPFLYDARSNLADWQSFHEDIVRCMRRYRANPWLRLDDGRTMNPEGTVSGMVWNMQRSWQADRTRLDPLLDFNEPTQTVFIRRGLLIYCELVLEALRAAEVHPALAAAAAFVPQCSTPAGAPGPARPGPVS